MKAKCTIEGCDKPRRSAELCAMHWNKFKRHGSPHLGGPKIKHGRCGDPEYAVWEAMIARCHNPHSRAFKDYGERGIAVCERWRDYANFIADMGSRPSPTHTIERVENNIGYEPTNCKWATRREQSNNTRRNQFVVLRGKSMTIAQAARELGLRYDTAWSRVNKGIPLEAPIYKGGPRG